ncbi:sensor histidine kinase [Undibacter mobilis]|uniref:histidine kinase n=1 Tax=Undibacter mobilis TaxID=2292256 RepID=A0A371B6K7_9BRAD|nr:HAMP domain-containing sensor histidine kinase [Undibacter mobilis]RDV03226.1 sensor histidine kinase [Undibacter mobilis]
MKPGSLRLRLIAGGIVAILIALSIAGFGLTVLFQRHVTRTLTDDLDVHLKQLIAGIDVGPQGDLVVSRPPADPRFSDPLSGLYWQVSGASGQLLRSRSLWDMTLKLPADALSPGDTHFHELWGPAHTRLLVAERSIVLSGGGQNPSARIAVAVDLGRIAAATIAFGKDLALALGLLGLVLAIATSIQVGLGLRPLDSLRRGIAEIRAGRRSDLPASVPAEVQPLVEEVNALLKAQAVEIERSRGRAADLAHGLKTPLAALASDVVRLRASGQDAVASDIEAIGDAMSRHVDRELARARIRGRVRLGVEVSTALAPLVRSLVTTVARTPAAQHVTFDIDIADGFSAPFDRTDLAEVLGNLLENAVRHAKSRVRIAAGADGRAAIHIEDDGPGIADSALPRALERGVRLDERGGAGLGLSIVQDVLAAYKWRLELGHSNLGGLKATIAPEGV